MVNIVFVRANPEPLSSADAKLLHHKGIQSYIRIKRPYTTNHNISHGSDLKATGSQPNQTVSCALIFSNSLLIV